MNSEMIRILSSEEENLVSAGMDSCRTFGFFDTNKALEKISFKTIDAKQDFSLYLSNDKRRNDAFRNRKQDNYGVPYTYGKSKTKSKRCQFFNW